MSDDPQTDRCALCGRAGLELTLHHLIPRTRHKNKRNKRTFTREEVRRRTCRLCRPCHKTVHAVFTEKQLERTYNTLEALRDAPAIGEFVQWVRRQKPGRKITVRRSRSRG
jgi:hypothetical protein